ncbi:galactokinase family protein [Brachybacterium sp. J144]|uniref:GHMP family kinase ATP-binding protein n=1 Tax=Brachybacterium sp. J144 TaxID=3116487 RepID=UPI002E79E2CA|nr:galactokinase family protein [Brachybacterium sp. J144]MEE1650706.1 galactokinase family protein [Brachybacterium sp. J144]
MSTAQVTWQMPGRLEVLGKHTDYGGGRVLVCAVDRGVTVHAAVIAGADGTLEATTDVVDGSLRLRAGEEAGLPAGHWGRYLQTVLDRLTANFGALPAARLEISSTLPPASGMSSSSALLTGTALALADLAGLPSTETWQAQIPDRVAVAGYAASIENGKTFGTLAGRTGVGTSGGSLDHTGMLTSEAGMLSYAEFDPMRILDRVALPEEWSFVVAVSGVLAEKTGGAQEAYNRGPALLGELLARWNRRTGRADASLQAALRGVLGEDLAGPVAVDEEPRLAPLLLVAEPGSERERLEQFVRESAELVPAAHRALRDGDLDAFAAAVRTSQRFAATHLGNQVPETIELVRLAEELGARAASAFGAGFGGSVWGLVPTSGADVFAADWLARYRASGPGQAHDRATTLVTRPGPAGMRVE